MTRLYDTRRELGNEKVTQGRGEKRRRRRKWVLAEKRKEVI